MCTERSPTARSTAAKESQIQRYAILILIETNRPNTDYSQSFRNNLRPAIASTHRISFISDLVHPSGKGNGVSFVFVALTESPVDASPKHSSIVKSAFKNEERMEMLATHIVSIIKAIAMKRATPATTQRPHWHQSELLLSL